MAPTAVLVFWVNGRGISLSIWLRLLGSNQAKPKGLPMIKRCPESNQSLGKEKGPTRWVGPFCLAPPAGLELGKAEGFAND